MIKLAGTLSPTPGTSKKDTSGKLLTRNITRE
jgi:hypothetical protein